MAAGRETSPFEQPDPRHQPIEVFRGLERLGGHIGKTAGHGSGACRFIALLAGLAGGLRGALALDLRQEERHPVGVVSFDQGVPAHAGNLAILRIQTDTHKGAGVERFELAGNPAVIVPALVALEQKLVGMFENCHA